MNDTNTNISFLLFTQLLYYVKNIIILTLLYTYTGYKLNIFMLYIIKEQITSGHSDILLYLLSLASIILSIYTIIAKNPIHSILFLISLFVTISLYLILIGLSFIGLSYLLVYVGAISILFLFIVMLINIRVSELLTNNNNFVILSVLTTLLFYYYSRDMLPYFIPQFEKYSFSFLDRLTQTYYISLTLPLLSDNKAIALNLISWDNAYTFFSHIVSIGNVLYTNFFILFIITSLILLLAMIGAIVITSNSEYDKTLTNQDSRSKSNIVTNPVLESSSFY